jgi:hypothetical protein
MNFDPSWRANGEPTIDTHHAVGVRLAGGDQTIDLRYFPRTLPWSLPLWFISIGLCFGIPIWGRRMAKHLK